MAIKARQWLVTGWAIQPIIFIILNVIIFSTFNLDKDSVSWREIMVIYLPLLSVLIFAVPIYRVKIGSFNIEVSKSQRKFIISTIILTSFLIFMSILNLAQRFGGLADFISLATSGGAFTIYIQNNLSRFSLVTQLGLFTWVILPALVSILYIDSVIRRRHTTVTVITITLGMLALLAASWVLSARVIVIYALFSLIISRLSLSRKFVLVRKEYLLLFAFASILLVYVILGQIYNKGNSTLDTKSGSQIVYNYYSESIKNGTKVINNSYQARDYAYWTTRTLMNMPIVGKTFQGMYESYLGSIPIRDRRGDFLYAQNLGVNPAYNTFSMPGYMYLDYGLWSILILTIFWLFTFIVYKLSIDFSPYFSVIYSVTLVTALDYARTATIFSDYGVYTMIVMIIFFTVALWRRHRVR